MPFETITPPHRLYRQVADQLRHLFDAGEFAVGDRLPPERQLAERMGISRPTIREALIALEVEGRVRIKVGSGIYVAQPPRIPAAPATGEGPFELLRARQFIESAIAEEAARLAGPDDIAALDAALARMSQDTHPSQTTIAHDRDFHTAIASILGNAVLVRVVGELFDQRMTPFFARLSSYFENSSSWREAMAEHRAVRDAIAERDPARARAAMNDHLRKSQDRFSESFAAPAGRQGAPAKEEAGAR